MSLPVAPQIAVEAFPGGGSPTKKSSEKRETPVAVQKAVKASRPAVDAGPPLEEIHEIGEDGRGIIRIGGERCDAPMRDSKKVAVPVAAQKAVAAFVTLFRLQTATVANNTYLLALYLFNLCTHLPHGLVSGLISQLLSYF
jgi:hypothetical protein